MNLNGARNILLLLFSVSVIIPAQAQSVRDHTRLTGPRETTVTESQANDLTLTLSAASVRPVQTWVRTAATIDKDRKILTARLFPPEAGLIKPGQRVRAFPPESRSSMYQAKIVRVVNQGEGVMVEAALPGQGRENSLYYVMEIVVDQGEFLSVANEAIIEEGDKHIVYVQQQPGHYLPREIQTGLQGELFTHVLEGLTEGDQVVTFGSFFIDSEHKLRGTVQPR